MIKKIYTRFIYELLRFKGFVSLLSIFSIKEAFKLVYFKIKEVKENYIYFKPKTFPYDIKIRDSYRDKRTLRDVFLSKYHLPPKEVVLNKNAVVIDLGCNTGLTIAHMKNIYPDIKILGYEMDIDNFLLAKRNTKPYNNIYLYNRAIWIDNSVLEYFKDSSFDGYSLSIVAGKGFNAKIQGITINDIIEEHQLERIDYLKMDIEGAEKDILTHHDLSWLKYVYSINIEMHLTKEEDINSFVEILKDQGFTIISNKNHVSSIIAIKKE